MNPAINGCGGRVPHEESRHRAQDIDVHTEPPVLGLEFSDLSQLLGRGTTTQATIDLGLQHPPADGFMADTNLLGNRSSRRGQRRVLAEVISHQTHRAGPNLRINLLRHVLILATQKNRHETTDGSRTVHRPKR
jgi:hypothetical protein